MIWDIDPKLPWHVAFALLEISSLSYLVTRYRNGNPAWKLGAAGLVLVAAAHVVYSLVPLVDVVVNDESVRVPLAEKFPLVGPHPLPWHGVFVAAEIFVFGYVAYYWRKHGKVTQDVLLWPLIVVSGHAFYTIKLADESPTFDLEVRWYGVAFAIGLMLAARAFPVYFERWGYPRRHGEELCLWTPIGMLLGAHFVHMIFYETEAIVENPIRLFQLGSGLASHGGGLGAILGVVFFAWKRGLGPKTMLKYMDPGMCASTWVIPWVRVGNFFNSEIVGRPWDGPWAIVFPRHDCPGYPEHVEACEHAVARHPSQAYEAILAFIMVGLAVYLERKWRNRLRPGAILFILLGYYFSTRFLVELLKDRQGVDDETFLSMGQMLSIPIVLVCIYMLFFSKISNIRSTIAGPEVIDNPPPLELPEGADRGTPKAADAGEERDEEPSVEGDRPAPKRTSAPKKKKKKRKG